MNYERIVLQHDPQHVEIDWEGRSWYRSETSHDSIGEFTRIVKVSEENGDMHLTESEEANRMF